MTLPHEERDTGGERDRGQYTHRRSGARHRDEVEGEDHCAHEHDGQHAAEVVHRLGRIAGIGWYEEYRGHQCHDGERQCHEEHRVPAEHLEQCT